MGPRATKPFGPNYRVSTSRRCVLPIIARWTILLDELSQLGIHPRKSVMISAMIHILSQSDRKSLPMGSIPNRQLFELMPELTQARLDTNAGEAIGITC